MFLSPREIEQLTGRVRPGWQRRALDHMGIPYRVRPDGTLVVLRIHVETREDNRPRREPRLRLDA